MNILQSQGSSICVNRSFKKRSLAHTTRSHPNFRLRGKTRNLTPLNFETTADMSTLTFLLEIITTTYTGVRFNRNITILEDLCETFAMLLTLNVIPQSSSNLNYEQLKLTKIFLICTNKD